MLLKRILGFENNYYRKRHQVPFATHNLTRGPDVPLRLALSI